MGIVEPVALGTEDLFDDITATALTTATGADIEREVADVGTGIGRTDRTAHTLHDLIVRDVIAHIHHLGIGQLVAHQEFVVSLNLDGTAHEDVLNTEAFITQTDTLCGASCHDDDTQAQLHGQLNGIAILDVHRTHGFSTGMQGNGFCAQHTIDIENDGAYLL